MTEPAQSSASLAPDDALRHRADAESAGRVDGDRFARDARLHAGFCTISGALRMLRVLPAVQRSVRVMLLRIVPLLCFQFTYSASSQIDWPQLTLTLIATNQFSSPTHITHAGDSSNRVFVAQQDGRVKIYRGSNVAPDLFLDISDRVLAGGERGLLSIGFPPQFEQQQHFYVNYTRKPDGATVVSRFSCIGGHADTNTEQIILTIPQPFPNHNGGQLAFGPDGYLYIGMGDGGYSASVGDPYNLAQNSKSLLGKLLRIDTESDTVPYSIPPGNPFVSNTNYLPEIWALGLRNPWRFSFDRGNGDLYIGDVGHQQYEEIDYQPASSAGGENYGWRLREGPLSYAGQGTNLAEPITFFGRLQSGASVTGGFVARGPNAKRLAGIYFFADYITGRIFGCARLGTNWIRRQFVTVPLNISTFGEDEAGDLYLADHRTGNLYALNDTGVAYPPRFTPSSGVINSEFVTLSSDSPNSIIRYTTNGIDPVSTDPGVPSGSTIMVTNGVLYKARTFRGDLTESSVTNALFSYFQVATPTFFPASGPVTNGTVVALSNATPGAVIHYTIDGSEPTPASLAYSAPFVVNGGTTIRAIGIRQGFTNSSIATLTYLLQSVATPTFSPAAGPITNQTQITIHCPTPAAVIRFTMNGADPDTGSTLYTGPIWIDGDTTLKARAFAANYGDSAVQSVTFRLLEFDNTVVRTLAGGWTAGFADGPGYLARFNGPQGICVDTNGNVYVADMGNNRIRKVNQSGEVVTIAGSGVSGIADGVGTNAQFSAPTGIGLDAGGLLYVADRGNCHRIRRIALDGTVTTIASLQECYYAPSLWHLDLDTATNLYVGQQALMAKMIFPTWQIVWAPGQNGNFSSVDWTTGRVSPAFDRQTTNLYVASGVRIHRFDPDRNYSLFSGDYGGHADGPRTNALFDSPMDVAVDQLGNVFVAQPGRIRKIATNGRVTTYAGEGSISFSNGWGRTARLNASAVRVDPRGVVYFADAANHSIRQVFVDTDGDAIPDLLETPESPYAIGVDDRDVDSDQDGVSNFDEYYAGTDAGSPSSIFRVIASLDVTPSTLKLRWLSAPARTYEVQRMDSSMTWQTVGVQIIGNGLEQSFTEPIASESAFYRVVVGGF
jgi:hypothetical protein